MNLSAYVAASVAILLWASLASLSTFVSDIPTFFLTGASLVIGSLISIHKIKKISRSLNTKTLVFKEREVK